MDSDVRWKSSASRRGSRRSVRSSDWRENEPSPVKSNSINNFSSSEDENTDKKKSNLAQKKKTERSGSGRSRVTPCDLVTASEPELDKDLKDFSPGTITAMSKLPPHYFQDPDSAQYGNNLDEYDTPIVKANNRGLPGGRGRRLGPNQHQGSSLSSSDNNSDTTYAESDINNSLLARMAAFDNDIAGTPPDPAPPEVPPRGPSHHHPLLTSQRRGVGNPSPPNYSDQQEDGYQQPATNVFLSQEYLMSGTSPRYGGTGGAKSPGGTALFGPSPREYLPSDYSQPSRMIGTLSSTHKGGGGLTSTIGGGPGVGLTALPTVRNNLALGSRSSFSGRDLHLGKNWKEKCSWRIAAIVLIGVCTVLASLLTYFAAAYASLDGCSHTKGCIVVEDAAKVIAQGADVHETTISYPTPAYTIPVTTFNPNHPSQKDASSTGTELTRLQTFSKRYSNQIAPQGHWNVQFVVKQPMFMRFNMSVPRSSQIAFYGRRLVAPSITQYNFVKFLRSGRTTRVKRALTTTESPERKIFVSPLVKSWLGDWPDDDFSGENTDIDQDYYDYSYYQEDQEGYSSATEEQEEEESHSRSKRYLNSRQVNVSLVEYLDTGTWYLSIFNDGLATMQVSLLVEEAPELQSACLNDCSEHGSCSIGRCKCVQGWVGEDCSESVCPILCSGHGIYGGGICHCNKGWKGQECDIPDNDCETPYCSGHGTCIGGICLCRGTWKGDRCDIVDCQDPSCGSHGWCIDGTCICRAGWQGHNCSQVDHKVFTCLPDCSRNGHYDLHTSACVCDAFWTGSDCSEARCALNCDHGTCDGGVCSCEPGWTGARCNERDCDPRCNHHGQCHNGTCLCIQGWNGRHCTIPGCLNACSGNGLCTTEAGEYRCSCSIGWAGKDCSVALETQCNDEQDNDGDSLADCNDSECCSTPECKNHVLCMVSADPVEVLLRKQPPAVTASFYQRVKFIIEDRNVQSFARKDEFTERRVSVIRGQVVNKQGQGIVGVRTSIEKESKFGLTATRKEGWFDVLVNGGGAVTLQFTRAHFDPLTLTVPVLWNQIVVLDPVIMWLKDERKPVDNQENKIMWSEPCLEHNNELMKPQIVSTSMPQAIGSTSQKSAILTETQIVQESLKIPGSNLNLVYHSSSVAGYLSTLLLQLTQAEIPKSLTMVHLKVVLEGSVYEKLFEADPNITYTFTWNKRNVYKQKVYGEAVAKISIGYEYSTCSNIVWETQISKLQGFQMDISDIGGWNLDIHHMYNFEAGLLQRGDGSTLNVKSSPHLVKTIMGTGIQRPLKCSQCHGPAKDATILSPSSLASGSDGSIYIGDFNLIRKVDSEGMVSTILELSTTQVSYGYYIAVSPADGHVYISDPEKYRVIRLLAVANVTDTLNNFEVVAGNGERCIPGDERRCGDRGLSKKARLSHPKGLAISSDRTMYIADGTNIRMVDPQSIIHTLIGHHGHKTRWKPLPCTEAMPANQVELQWPTALALSTLDNTLHILDDHVVLQVTDDGSVRVKAGTPLHCKASDDHGTVGTITSFDFSPSGSLFLAEETSNKVCIVKELSPAGKMKHFAGVRPADCGCVPGRECMCAKEKVSLSTNVLMKSVSAITVSAGGVVHVAEQNSLRIFGFFHYLPDDDEKGDYKVAYPKTNEYYIFSRHGHHIETRDLVTGRKLYSFFYSKNTSFGKLSKVTDSSGNKMMFLRDYKSSVSQIENTFGKKFKVSISRLRLMTKFAENDDRVFDYAYDDDTGLLLSKTTPGRLTTVYEYDSTGRIVTMVSPTGSRSDFRSFMGGLASNRNLYIEIGVDDMQQGDSPKQRLSYESAINNGVKVQFKHNSVVGALESWSNGTWRQIFPWGGTAMALSSSSNPLLEAVLPIQAKLLPISQQYTLSAASEGATNVLVTSYGIVDDRQRQERLVETVFLVNGSRVLSRKWKGSDLTEELTDGERKSMLKVHYNDNGQPTRVVLGNGLSTINITYDKFGRQSGKNWEKSGEEYDYDQNGFLSAVTTKTSAVTRYTFNNNGLLESITLPSGRSWGYRYDKRGGLKFITTPSGSAHVFSMQPSFGAYVFSYTPPGAQHPYLQHLDHEGKLIFTSFPAGASKILYIYTNSNQLKEILSGDGKTTFIYGNDGLVKETFHEENDLEYKIDYAYQGRLLQEFRLDYGARTGLSNVKFTYEYDSNFRVTQFGGRIGGQKLVTFPFTYSSRLGLFERIGLFKISRPNNNEIIIHDGTAIFSRKTDSQFKVTRLSVTIHKMEVFRLDITYTKDGKIVQTNTHTRNFHSKPYTNTKNYTYDADGQLTAVDAKEPWNFSYDAFGNMLSLTYSTNTIPMKYDSQDRIIKFGEGGYNYDSRGAIVQNVRKVNYQYNARGMLTRAFKSGRFNIRYMYDHEGRLIARKDNFGNVTQFMYANLEHPHLVSHIYNPRDGNLINLFYDDRGHVIFAQMYRNKYYIATDECGTPIMVFNQYGEVVREIMRSPYGHIIYDSNPYLYLPIDYCGGILETKTELVHMPSGKVYDPLIGLLLSPQWEAIPGNLMTPNRLSLYRFNGNDPININRPLWRSFGLNDWLNILGYDIKAIAPQMSLGVGTVQSIPNNGLWSSFTRISTPSSTSVSPFTHQVKSMKCISGMLETQLESLYSTSKLSSLRKTRLRQNFDPDSHQFEISTMAGPFGEGVLVSVVNGKAIISATPQANPIFRDVLTSVFNNSLLLDIVLTSRSTYVFYFVKENFWKASEDMTQLNRIGGEVNITVHEPSASTLQGADSDKVVDIKLHSSSAIIHIRYGTTPSLERRRLLKHAKKMTIRRAWAEEREKLSIGLPGSLDWSPSEVEELLTHGSVSSYSARYLHQPEAYPRLLDDPTNIQILKDTKRTRRNSKSRKSHRCKKKWWRVLC